MPKIEIMLQHGWGLSSKMWKNFIKFFPCCEIHNIDRGYFYTEKFCSFIKEYSFKIGIVHSIGLHLFSKDLFSSLNILIIFSSFLNFHKNSLNKTIISMKNDLEKKPNLLLYNFYKKAFNQKSIFYNKKKINKEKLKEDLNFLEKSYFNINFIKNIPKILVFHSKYDKIIHFKKALEIKQNLEHALLYNLDSFSHMLPITHIKEVLPLIKKHLPLEEKIYKEKIIKSFTKQLKIYSKNNHFQKKANKDLFMLLKKNKSKIIKGIILEIGSGTGSFTKNLIKIFINRIIEITDLSQAMVDSCKKLFLKKNRLFYVLDGENLNRKENYALIVSAMSIQWFYNLENSFRLIWQALKKNGAFLFNFLEKDSFHEWTDICLNKIIFNPLPSIEEVKFYLKANHFRNYHLEKKSYTISYSSVLSFLQNFKKTGACVSLFQNNTKNICSLLTLMKKQNKTFFSITYKVGIGIAFK